MAAQEPEPVLPPDQGLVRPSPIINCSGYEARAVTTPVTIVKAKIIMMPAWMKNDPVTAGSGSTADAKHSPMNPMPVSALPSLRILSSFVKHTYI